MHQFSLLGQVWPLTDIIDHLMIKYSSTLYGEMVKRFCSVEFYNLWTSVHVLQILKANPYVPPNIRDIITLNAPRNYQVQKCIAS